MSEVILIDGVKEYILKAEADRAHGILADRLKEVRAQCDNLQAENERLKEQLRQALTEWET